MTMRSKQRYIKASRLSNSFANNSIGCPSWILLQQQDNRRDNRWSQIGRGGRGAREERVSKGIETVGFVAFGLRRKVQMHRRPPRSPNQNFKYFWLGFGWRAVAP